MAEIFNPDNPGTDSTGRFLNKNVQAGIGGTVILAETLNQIGDESDALIKAAGLTPSNKDVTQWLQAIRKLYGDADTALKAELISKIEALTASDITFDDSISISASDVQEAITALHTLIKGLKAKDISFEDTISLGASNLQDAILKIIQDKIYPIGSVYIQIAKEDGSFDENESPENLFGGIWETQYADEGIFLRTEGGNSNENRIDGVQGDAIRNMTGLIQYITLSSPDQTGMFSGVFSQGISQYPCSITTAQANSGQCHFNAANQVPTGSDVRGINRQMRIHKRIA